MFLCISITPEIIQFQLICTYLYIKSLIVQVDVTKSPEDIGLLCHLEEVADEELEEEASPHVVKLLDLAVEGDRGPGRPPVLRLSAPRLLELPSLLAHLFLIPETGSLWNVA